MPCGLQAIQHNTDAVMCEQDVQPLTIAGASHKIDTTITRLKTHGRRSTPLCCPHLMLKNCCKWMLSPTKAILLPASLASSATASKCCMLQL